MFMASQNSHVDVVQILIEAGADPNKTDENGRSALNTAASKGHEDIVKLLIDAGADLNVKGKWGTPLKEAIDDKKPGVVKLLRAAGAKE